MYCLLPAEIREAPDRDGCQKAATPDRDVGDILQWDVREDWDGWEAMSRREDSAILREAMGGG